MTTTKTLATGGHLEYRGLHIEPKRDFGRNGGTGWLVTDGVCNVLPGATWAHSIEGAVQLADDYIMAGGLGRTDNQVHIDDNAVAPVFWRLVRARQEADRTTCETRSEISGERCIKPQGHLLAHQWRAKQC
jgi:hypothetical protein